MKRNIDCLLVGHNEGNFQEYAEFFYQMDKKSPIYRELKPDFIWHENKRFTVPDVFNKFSSKEVNFGVGSVFSTTIAYLATYLNKNGFSFDFVNDFQNEKKLLVDKLKNDNVLSVAITTTLYALDKPIVEIVEFIREYNKDCKIIVGGPFILNQYFGDRESGNNKLGQLLKILKADFLVTSSQGEAALIKILSALKNRGSFDDINNITYWKKGTPGINIFEQENNSLDNNVTNWELFADKVGKFVSVRTCLSCPFNCYFCGFCQRAGKHRTATVESVEKELDILRRIGTVERINFIDDTFNAPAGRFKKILRMMIKNDYGFKWNGYLRCQMVDEEMVSLMEESGCEGVYLGIESANQKILDNMNKKVKVKDYCRGIALLKNSNILIHTNFIVGFVGETAESINDSVNFVREYEPDFYRFQLWFLDRVTPIWEKRQENKIGGANFYWSHETMNAHRACDYLDEIALGGFKKSVWVPAHNFNLHNLYRLISMGMKIEDIKSFLRLFNEGSKENIQNLEVANISKDLIVKIKKILS